MLDSKFFTLAGLLVISVFLSCNITMAFAFTADYQWGIREFKTIPTFCLIEPPDTPFHKNVEQGWIDETKNAVAEWETKLRMDSTRPERWSIDFIFIPSNEYDLSTIEKCNVIIKFVKAAPKEQNWLGVYRGYGNGNGEIDITYGEAVLCGLNYDKICFEDDTKTRAQIGSVIRHEIGHALGLGHYVADDYMVNAYWYNGKQDAPSIMIQYHYHHSGKQKISDMDIKKLYAVYGSNGFGNRPVIKQEPEISEIINDNDYQTVPITVKKYESVTEKFSGKVPKDLISKGKKAEIIIIKPDNSKEILKLIVTKDGYFEYPFIFNDKFQQGKYYVSISYDGVEIKKIAYDITAKTTNQNSDSVKKPSKTDNNKIKKNEPTLPKKDVPNYVKSGDRVTITVGKGMNTINVKLPMSWKQTGGEKVRLSSASTAEPVFTAPHVEKGKTKILSFRFMATDSFGETYTDAIKITVLPR